jgi:YHS domain-containing protein
MKWIIFWSIIFWNSALQAQQGNTELPLRTKNFNIEKSNLALQGYDAVSYFSGKPQKGQKTISVSYKGVLYWFTSAQNLATFNANPDKYEPAYGGWCAYAMGAKGEKVEVDAENFKIIKGKNYLFYKSFFSNTIDDWNKDEASLFGKAETNWKKIYR